MTRLRFSHFATTARFAAIYSLSHTGIRRLVDDAAIQPNDYIIYVDRARCRAGAAASARTSCSPRAASSFIRLVRRFRAKCGRSRTARRPAPRKARCFISSLQRFRDFILQACCHFTPAHTQYYRLNASIIAASKVHAEAKRSHAACHQMFINVHETPRISPATWLKWLITSVYRSAADELALFIYV